MQTMLLGLLSNIYESTHRSILDRLMPYPPVCAEFQNSLYVVDGVKRCSASRIMPPIMFEKRMEKPEDQILFWLKINLSYRQINEMEKAIIVAALVSIKKENNEIIQILSPYIDLNKNLINQYVSYLEFYPNLQRYISLHSPAKNVVRFFLAVKKEILQSMDKLLPYIDPNPSTLKTMLLNANEIFVKTKSNVLESEELTERLAHSGLKGVTDFLNEKRFPTLLGIKNKIDATVAEIKVDSIKINYDHSLEADGVNITANIKNSKDIKKVIKELELIEKSDLIKKIEDAKNDI